MAISCTYCGGSHALASDVRACWQRTQGEVVVDDTATPPERDVPPTQRSTPRTPALPAQRARLMQHRFGRPGPEQLARNLVVRPGALVPEPWTGCHVVVVDAGVLDEPIATIDELRVRGHRCERVVIELRVPFHDPPDSTTDAPPYELGARFWLPLDVLHELIWSNAIDATSDEPSWALYDAAISLGAAAVPVVDGDAAGDVELPDGRRVWIDGGQYRRVEPIDGHAVLHAISIEHGLLEVASTNPSSAELADDQRAAVDHPGAAVRVIAPAGSGKTRVLTERARHLLDDWHVPPGALTLIAFNKRAQEEMVARTSDLRGMQVRTLNAIALSIVNGVAPFAPQRRRRRTIDEVEVRGIIGQLVQFPRKRNTDPVAVWIEALSAIRLGLRTPADVEDDYEGEVEGLQAIWPRYRAALDGMDAVDFDEQIYAAIELLLRDPAARRAAQRACRVLLVDEFQDLTPAHVLLVRLLSAPQFNVFGVGDDDQTIYGYNGADPAWLIDFESLFPQAAAHPLQVNYRCPADVVEAADRLVRHNRRRVPKVIRPARPGTSGLRVVVSDNALDDTTTAVRAAIESGRQPTEVAVLTRVNAMLAPVQVALAVGGIAVQGGVGTEFLDRTSVRSAMSWLRLVSGSPEQLASNDLAEALRRPSRPMHPNVATWVAEQSSISGLKRLAGRIKTERDASRVATFAADIERLQQLAGSTTTADLFRAMADDLGLRASVATLDDGRHGMNRGSQSDDLTALAQLATLQPDPSRFGGWLRQQLSLPRSTEGVTLATVHRVKGQEWPVVVLHQCAGDQYPHRLADDVEEERRVFHVAITRGADQVTVVCGPDRSPFVDEMLNEPPELEAIPVVAGGTRATGPTGSPQKKRRATASSGTGFEKGVVLAAPGLVLVDGGQEWTIDSIGDDGVVVRHGELQRRVAVDAKVITLGRQQGRLCLPAPDSPGAASIRALDLLRRAREQLRDGKPAYVVFHDATIERIALALPTSPAELRLVDGIGATKLEQYGDAVLVAVEDALGAD